MTLMDTDEALAEYEAARHRLPAPPRAGAAVRLTDLSGLADRFDAFLLDAFGVLNIGDQAIEGAPERIRGLQAAGKRVLVLTNAASVPRAALHQKYATLGYRFAAGDIVSSRDVLMSAMADEPGQQWGVMAEPELQGADLDGLRASYLGADRRDYTEADAFLLLGSGGWSAERQTLLERALLDRPRPVWVGNPDIIAPRQFGLSVEPGFYAHKLAERTGIAPRFFGKPFRNIFDHAFDRLGAGFNPARTVMVGDSLHTDVLGALNAGIASALVAGYGLLSGYDVASAISRTGISPDYIVARP